MAASRVALLGLINDKVREHAWPLTDADQQELADWLASHSAVAVGGLLDSDFQKVMDAAKTDGSLETKLMAVRATLKALAEA